MADFVFNVSLGRVAELAALPGANDALVAVVLESAGLEADATLRKHDDLAALLAATNNEQLTMGRKTLVNILVTTDDTNNLKTVDADDLTWVGATGNATGCVVICYDPDTTVGTDADLIPLVKLGMAVTPSGGDVVLRFNTAGLFQAA